jgi:hypothetical protein
MRALEEIRTVERSATGGMGSRMEVSNSGLREGEIAIFHRKGIEKFGGEKIDFGSVVGGS